MLQGGQRGVGMCTDAMLYVLHMGARVIGKVDDPQQYNAYCGPATARLLLETIYQDFISSQPGVLHLHLVNHEHLWTRDAHLHKQVDYFLVSGALRPAAPALLELHAATAAWTGYCRA